MPIRNMWSLKPGEVLTAERLKVEIPGCEIYFPLKDIGVDLLVVRGNSHVGIQVKESRYYQGGKVQRGTDWHNSWHQVSEGNLGLVSSPKKKAADFFVFLTYLPNIEKTKISSFIERYIIVPLNELCRKVPQKRASRGVYSFLFMFDGDTVTECREDEQDYSEFLETWQLIDEALKGHSGS